MSAIPSRTACQDAVLDALARLGGQAERSHIVALAEDLGCFTAEQRRTPPPPTKRRYKSYLAYNLSWALTELHRDGAVRRVSRGVWRLA